MIFALISDIHSNLEALDKVLGDIKKLKIDKILCVGDIVGYGANPRECIDIVKNLKAVTVAGNHDWAVSEQFSFEYFNNLVKEALVWTKGKLIKEDIEYLKNLPLIHNEKKFMIVHGSLDSPEKFYYTLSESDAIESFGLMKKNICFVGHTHYPGVFHLKNNEVSFSEASKIKLDPKEKYIINIGSVGQPRDGNPKSSFVLIDTDKNIVEIKRIDYDIKSAQEKIIKNGLPVFFAERLGEGR